MFFIRNKRLLFIEKPSGFIMTKKDIEDLALELLSKPSSAYLATIDRNGFPHIRAIFNLRCSEKFPHPAEVIEEYEENPLTVYISTNTSSIKMKQIKENNNIAIYYSLPSEGKGIMLQGQAEILDDMELKEKIWVDDWVMYYPKGYTDPDFTILRLKPKYLKGWYKGPHELYLAD